jgi:hypothetical protein
MEISQGQVQSSVKEPHTLFLQFSCGHEYFASRVPGGVSDWHHCLCDYCQPYHAIVIVNHSCGHCGGSFLYFRNDPQIRLSEEEARKRMEYRVPLFGKKTETVTT